MGTFCFRLVRDYPEPCEGNVNQLSTGAKVDTLSNVDACMRYNQDKQVHWYQFKGNRRTYFGKRKTNYKKRRR